ncbi:MULTISPECIES: SHD1 domain-containing protein [Rhodopirellula]|nr:SHD1 domain-containing protein [Rhodopirellula europaea]
MKTYLLWLTMVVASATNAAAKDWSDSTGHYSITGEMIAFSDSTVVLKKANSDLVAVPLEKLSKQDQEYVDTEASKLGQSTGSTQVWTLKSGLKMPGRIVGFDKHPVVIQRRLGRVYVNNRRFDKMPGVYRAIIPKIVEHFTGEEIAGEKELEQWAKKLKGEPRTFECAGVMIELEDGDLYCAPFFLFTDKVVSVLKPGWERWLAAKEDYEAKEQESFLAHAQAEAYQRQQMRAGQIQQLQLNLQAYDAGVFDLWEVTMEPPPGVYGMTLSVVVPARNNIQAAQIAKHQNPNYVVGPMRVVPRRN